MALCVKLHLNYIKLALCLVILFTKAVDFMLLRIKLDPVPSLDILLNFHPHDICINRQGHFICHGVDLSLFLLDRSSHVIKAFFHRQF